MKNELLFLAKMAVVFSVVDGFIPRAETLFAKSKTNNSNERERSRRRQQESTGGSRSSGQRNTDKTPNNYEYRPHRRQLTTEMHMGLLFDTNPPFHGSGSGKTKGALDEQWEIQQDILRARRGENAKKRKVEPTKVEVASSKMGAKVNIDNVVEDAAHHRNESKPKKFFWDVGQ